MKKRYILITAIFGFISAYAIPTNPVVISGEMTSKFSEANKMHLTVSDKAIVNWESFSIDFNERVSIIQPSKMSSILNRVTGNIQSEILGKLHANGHVFLINPQGVVLGEGAQINAASFLASTLDIADQDFLNQNYLFKGAGPGEIINYGNIITDVGSVTLLGRKVENHGEIISNEDFNVGLAEEILLQNEKENRVFIRAKLLDEENTGFSNLGKITTLRSEIQASSNPYSYAINLEGEITKPKAVGEGKFYLKAEGAKIVVAGKLDYNEVAISGDEIFIEKDVVIDVKDKGCIYLNPKDTATIKGTCLAPSGFISIIKQDSDCVLFQGGTLDVSAPKPGKIYLHTTVLLNSGKLLANSSLDKGGNIQIEALRIIDVERTQVSANGFKRGGKIEVLGAERLSTSGRYIATGKEKGGYIQARSNNLVLISPQFDASSEKMKGNIFLEVAERGRYFSLSHTKLSGNVSNIEVPKEKLLKGFGTLTLEEKMPSYLSFSQPKDEVLLTGPLFDENLLTIYKEPVKEIITSTPKDVLLRRNQIDDLGGMNKDSSPNLEAENKLLSAPLLLGGEDIPFTEDELIDPNASNGSGFGTHIVPLSTGNIVVTKPGDDLSPTITASGAAYLYNGETRAVIGVLTGSRTNDQVGVAGAIALENGNYVVLSSKWTDPSGPTLEVGAATWCNGTDGKPFGEASSLVSVSTSNSLVGTNANDFVGQSAVALSNGNYVVKSTAWRGGGLLNNGRGAVTWCPGTGVADTVSSANSLVGSTNGDLIGSNGVIDLKNGDYVVVSPSWNNGLLTKIGAVTYCDSAGSPVGPVALTNSLHGSTNNDQVGLNGALVLTDGSYVVLSPLWNTPLIPGPAITDVGAATWCDVGGLVGPVSTSNSLHGSTADDQVGTTGVALTNGNYVIGSRRWHNGTPNFYGAATFCVGDGTTVGPVDISNSLYGSQSGDFVGENVYALVNGDYVVASPYWDSPGPSVITNTGAVTWCSGTTGIPYNETVKGTTVKTTNSLHGSLMPGSGQDRVGLDGAFALPNGKYVVISHQWSRGLLVSENRVGAVTLCEADGSTIGLVSTSNSLHGMNRQDHIGYISPFVPPCIVLSNGNYVILSPFWDQNIIIANGKGAITWADGNTGITGPVDSSNSLLGTINSDQLGYISSTVPSAIALQDGNYFVASYYYDDGAISNAGAATIGNGTAGTAGLVTTSNSLIGGAANSGLVAIAEDRVNYSVLAGFSTEGSGRVRIAYLPKPPQPAPPPEPLSAEAITQINNTTTSARSEMFRTFHPYNDFIGKYLTFYDLEKIPSIKISVRRGIGDRFYLKNIYDHKIWKRKIYFVRQRTDKTESLEKEKTL